MGGSFLRVLWFPRSSPNTLPIYERNTLDWDVYTIPQHHSYISLYIGPTGMKAATQKNQDKTIMLSFLFFLPKFYTVLIIGIFVLENQNFVK